MGLFSPLDIGTALLPHLINYAGKQLGVIKKPKAPQAVAGATDALNGIGSQFGTLASDQLAQYKQDNAKYQGALDDYSGYLKTDYGNAPKDAAMLNRAAGNTDAMAQRATSNAQANAASRGLTGSSVEGGALAGIESARLTSQANTQNAVATQAIDRRSRNMQQLVGLLAQEKARTYSNGLGALGAQSGIEQRLLGQGNYQNGIARQDQQQTDAGLGSLAQILGEAIYKSKSGKK